MRNMRKIPAWPSLFLMVIIIPVQYHLVWDCDLSFWTEVTVYATVPIMLFGLFCIWSPYVIKNYTITSTWRDVVDERRFRIIGYVILIVLLVVMLIALYDYQKNYQDRDEFYFDRHTQKIVPKKN